MKKKKQRKKKKENILTLKEVLSLLNEESISTLSEEQNNNILSMIRNAVTQTENELVSNLRKFEKKYYNSVEEFLKLFGSSPESEVPTSQNKEKISNIFENNYKKLNTSIYQTNIPFFNKILTKKSFNFPQEFCTKIKKELNSYEPFQKFVLKMLQDEFEKEEGNVFKIYTSDLCSSEKMEELKKQSEIIDLFGIYSSLIQNTSGKRITIADIEAIWNEFHSNPELKNLITNYTQENKFFSKENPKFILLKRKSIKLLPWQKLFFTIFDKLRGSAEQEPFVPPPIPPEIASGITRAIFKPGFRSPEIVINPPPSSSAAADALRARLTRSRTAPGATRAELQESLQLKKLSLKEAMEKEYD